MVIEDKPSTLQTSPHNSIQTIDDLCKPDAIHQNSLQLLSAGLTFTLNRTDQFENECIH